MPQYPILSGELVYPPDEDSRLLLLAAQEEITDDDSVLEIGVGSGYVSAGILDTSRSSFLVGTDINPYAVRMAYTKGVPVVRTDLCQGIRGRFDLILFNPPYLPTLPEERLDDWLEYALDGGPSGRDCIERFLREIKPFVAPNGRILLLISSLTGSSEVETLIRECGFVSSLLQQKKVEGGEFLLVYRIRV